MTGAGQVAIMRKVRTLVGKPHGEQSCLRPRHSWKDNIKMDLREIGYGLKQLSMRCNMCL
jgi:hypothetical protein